MSRGKKYGPEEIIPKLREAEVLMSQGTTQELAAKQIGRVVKKLKRADGPLKYELRTLKMTLFSAELSV